MLVKAILIQWKSQQEFHSSKTYAISSYPKLKSEKLTLSNHHFLYWLATAVVENSIRVCPVYIGSDGANKRSFLHFYPSDLTVD
ncbi:hypothetical protein T06_8749 [Trichinella sp. T6]|nr:hypothetical protein T06_14208 [Trichinella sp. T6]KRX55135.1 hypothetical protein T06_5084 [Trichinella sp. T6]KRX55687.1 hypothetical protein T06_13780 [Trichinella sp. T6]KRX55688.1 hypothetical protein T06_5767 [Trichinella sp. T6]KRX55733.1 hypothetical protein T06_2184 [Trichinella sp. T6]